MRTPHRAPLLLALVALVALHGCARQDAKALVTSANEYLEKNDRKAALIQLSNARQQAPNDAEIRFLLGRTYLETGDAVTAEVELRRALELKHPPEVVLPVLAEAVVAQGEYRKAVAEFGKPSISDPKARAQLHAVFAAAAMRQGDIKETRAQLDQALANDPGLPRAHVVRAQLAMRGGDVAEAEAAIDAALAGAPNDIEGTLLKAQLLDARDRDAEAVALLERTAQAHPTSMVVRKALVDQHLRNRQTDKAAAVVDAMRKIAPKDFHTVHAMASVELRKGNADKARDLAQAMLGGRPTHPQALYLSAVANFQLKNYVVAEDALRKVLANFPNDVSARRLLALTYLYSGRTSQAVEIVDPMLRALPNEPAVLRLAAEVRLRTGNVAEATKLYERANALDQAPDATNRLRLASMRLVQGDTTRGLNELEQLSADDPTKIQADLALYTAHVRARRYDKAMAAIDAIESKQPGKALNAELRANVHMARRDYKQARPFFERALSLEPTRVSSARNLALIDLHEGKVADARARYEAIAKADPKNEAPLLGLAEVLALSGAPAADVKSALDRAIAADPKSPSARMALVAHHRRVNDNRGALEAARAAMNALPGDARMVEMYGAMLLASNEPQQARETFTRLTQLVPQTPGPWLRVSEAQLAAKDYAGALEAQRRALAIQPDYLPATVALATTHLLSGKPDDAVAEARRLQRDRPKQAVGFALEAEVLAAQRKYAEALVPLREALARQATTSLASRNYAMLVLAGRQPEAKAFADRWVKEHPKDATFLREVGQQRQATKDVPGAIAAYRAALEVDPDNVIVLNNLAWMLNEQGKPEARDLAERAYELAPLNASVVDTLGTVAMAQGDLDRARALLRQATHLSPKDSRLRINLARALAKGGDKAAARRELEQVVASDSRAAVKAEVEQLLREL